MKIITNICALILVTSLLATANTPIQIIWEFESSGTLMRAPISEESHDLPIRFPSGRAVKRIQGSDSFELATQQELDDWLEYTKPEPTPLDADLAEEAQLFKTILTIHFGEGAVTNTNVTERAVMQYFVNRRLSGTSEPTDASDGILLQRGFEVIKAYTGDGTVWSFPWEMLDDATE